MKDPEFGWDGDRERGRESGLAATLIGGFLMLTASIGMVYNLVLISVARNVLSQFEARLHAISAVIVLVCVFWAAARGLMLSAQGRGGLAVTGRALGLAAVVMWLLFAIGQVFVLVPRL